MSKRIIFCADGTWDSAQNDTNVYKLYKSIAVSPTQVAFYDDGVGADGTQMEKLAGGALGEGLLQKVRDGYTKIAHVYEEGDDIFIFGFSRGAYTARSVAGMVAICGLPTAAFDDNLVSTAFQAYRDKAQRAALLATLQKYGMFDAPIKMVGVWDTVGSLGIPALYGAVAASCQFLDTGLHQDVKNAFQALSIDERRAEFPPTLWTPLNPPPAGQALEQVWFAGVHADVGGGYPETGLSDIAFSWMVGKSINLGLEIDPNVSARYASLMAPKFALDTLHESWSPLWLFPKRRAIPNDAVLANSVQVRCQHNSDYVPKNLSRDNNGLPAAGYNNVPVVSPPPEA